MSTSLPTGMRCQFHGFVALNNHGVTLSEQGRYLYATEALVDALTVVKQTLSSMEEEERGAMSSREFENTLLRDVNSKVHKTLSRTLQTSDDSLATNVNTSEVAFPVAIHSAQGIQYSTRSSSTDISPQAQLHSNEESPVFFIRAEIEDPYEYSDSLEFSLDVLSAIILHNIAVTNVCMACQQTPQEQNSVTNTRKFFSRALSYFKLSQSLLQDLIESNEINGLRDQSQEQSSSCTDLQVFQSIIQTETVVLQALISVQQVLGQDFEASNERLQGLHRMSDEMQERISLVYPQQQSLNAPAA